MSKSYFKKWQLRDGSVLFGPQVLTIVSFSISFKGLEPSVPLPFARNVKGGDTCGGLGALKSMRSSRLSACAGHASSRTFRAKRSYYKWPRLGPRLPSV